MLCPYSQPCRKSLLKQFDPPSHKSNGNNSPNNDIECTLEQLAERLEIEEMEAHLKDIEVNRLMESDGTKGLVDVMAALSDKDHQKWQQDIKPIQMVLAKVQVN